jgi:hypothetical protein
VHKVIIGGPCYQMQMDARHGGIVAELGIRLRELRKVDYLQYEYEHGCPVEMPRNNLFRKALASEATHLVWMDSDCYFASRDIDGLIWIIDALAETKLPFCAVPVTQRDGCVNIVEKVDWTAEPPRFPRFRGTVAMEPRLRKCEVAGLGLAVFWLPWYRERWPTGPHFRTHWLDGRNFISEDFWHTWQLSQRHETRPRWCPMVEVTHAARGTAP